jgi:hypothetical protein
MTDTMREATDASKVFCFVILLMAAYVPMEPTHLKTKAVVFSTFCLVLLCLDTIEGAALCYMHAFRDLWHWISGISL